MIDTTMASDGLGALGSDADFRAAVRQWIAANAPTGLEDVFDWRSREIPGNWLDHRARAEAHPLFVEWERRCVEARLVCAAWPVEAGGRGWSRIRKAIFEEELHRARVPRIDRGQGEFLLGPTIVAEGTDEQKARLLPRIISGEDVYCQGFSEPDHGSDLAGLTTTGRFEGDQLVVNGQKVWTSAALESNMIFLLCRTEAEAPRHRGLTFAVLPFSADNGFEIAPIRQMSGGSDFAQEFITDARTPVENVIGRPGDGWRIAMTTLGFERDFNLPTLSLKFKHELHQMVRAARARGVDQDPAVRQLLARAHGHVSVIEVFAARMLADPHAAARLVSVSKLFWSEYHRWVTEQWMAVEGPQGIVRPAGEGYPTTPTQDAFLAARAGTIYAGTSEIQRNIIAERGLGLPR